MPTIPDTQKDASGRPIQLTTKNDRKESPRWLQIFDQVALRLIAVAFAGILLLLIWRIGFSTWRVESGNINDAILQTTQWAIATVLTAGAALVGLNWYQGEKRHERDQAELRQQQEQLATSIDGRLRVLEFSSIATIEMFNYQAVAKVLGNPDDIGFVDRAMRLYPTFQIPMQRRAVATILVEAAKRATGSHPTNYYRGEIPSLRQFTKLIQGEFPDLSQQLEEILGSDPQPGPHQQSNPAT